MRIRVWVIVEGRVSGVVPAGTHPIFLENIDAEVFSTTTRSSERAVLPRIMFIHTVWRDVSESVKTPDVCVRVRNGRYVDMVHSTIPQLLDMRRVHNSPAPRKSSRFDAAKSTRKSKCKRPSTTGR